MGKRVPFFLWGGCDGVWVSCVDAEGDVIARDGVGGLKGEGVVKGGGVVSAWEGPHPFAARALGELVEEDAGVGVLDEEGKF